MAGEPIVPHSQVAAVPQPILQPAPENPTSQSKQKRARRPPPPVPETAPSRNLRNRTKAQPQIAPPQQSKPPLVNPQAASDRSHTNGSSQCQTTAPIAMKPVQKPATHKYRLLRRELPDDATGLQVLC